jgi:hypothetical protein
MVSWVCFVETAFYEKIEWAPALLDIQCRGECRESAGIK